MKSGAKKFVYCIRMTAYEPARSTFNVGIQFARCIMPGKSRRLFLGIQLPEHFLDGSFELFVIAFKTVFGRVVDFDVGA